MDSQGIIDRAIKEHPEIKEDIEKALKISTPFRVSLSCLKLRLNKDISIFRDTIKSLLKE